MTFLTFLALGIAVLVAAPYVAHRLRRQRAEQHPFAPARLVPPRRRRLGVARASKIRLLFIIRALSVLALALLGASAAREVLAARAQSFGHVGGRWRSSSTTR